VNGRIMTLGRTSGAVLVSFGPKAAAGKVDTIAEATYLSRRQLGCAFSGTACISRLVEMFSPSRGAVFDHSERASTAGP
jgi:hypothetical protein